MEKSLKTLKHSEIIEPGSKYKPLKRYDYDMNVYEKWVELKCQNPPKRRSYHVSFIHKDFLYILGGIDLKEGRISDISCLSLNFADEIKWKNQEVTGDIPEPLSDHSGVLVEDNFYLFGGESEFGETKNTLYKLNLITFIWEKKNFPLTTIIELSNHTCSYYKENKSLVIFGGYNNGKYVYDIYTYKIKEEEWNKIEIDLNSKNVPEGRIKHSANIIDDYMYVYGGQNVDGNYLSDLWKFDLLNSKWQQIIYNNLSPDDIPLGRSGHSSIYNSKDHSLYIFGGKVSHAQERNELWKFDINDKQFKLIHDTLLEMESDFPPRSMDIHKIKQSILYYNI